MTQGILIGLGLVLAIFGLFTWRARKSRHAPSTFALAEDMRRFAHGFFHAPPAEQTERVDIFRETSSVYRRQGLSERQYARSIAMLDATLAPDEQNLLKTVTKNFVTGG
ncbi:MAG: hypothetical protein K0Q70_1987 [Rhodospirillales bacterium]|nr:hypothetical protein [Rhodospirillales bacterium]